jgi:alpha-D-ribose 1-methylphosphonate 5-triphosphate synthase subunit PhnG
LGSDGEGLGNVFNLSEIITERCQVRLRAVNETRDKTLVFGSKVQMLGKKKKEIANSSCDQNVIINNKKISSS